VPAVYAEPMPSLVGINHIALEVDDIDEALAFWESIFGPLQLRGRGKQMAFIDMGDQFLALARGQTQPPDQHRHFGLVVDDKEAVRARLRELDIPVSPGRGLDFRDPSGNLIQIVDYRDVQFTKTDNVLRAMGLDGLEKSESALAELRAKGVNV
jgi:lactoylglutathione lyase